MSVAGKSGITFFNPRLREGGDKILYAAHMPGKNFQSTPPRRRRPASSDATVQKFCFQSTPPRRRRLEICHSLAIVHNFQSTPPRRRRLLFRLYWLWVYSFSIHASAKEATQGSWCPHNPLYIFNPRLREGGDSFDWVPTIRKPFFNPRLREGGDRNIL